VGYTLRQILVIFFKLFWKLYWWRKLGKIKGKQEKEKEVKAHEERQKLRLLRNYQLSEVERNYLEDSDAKYYFYATTGLVFLLSGICYSVLHGPSWGTIPFIALTGLLWFGASVAWFWDYKRQSDLLTEEYKKKQPVS
jgi:hypothetical protein